jgi:hypothetical protein
MQDSHNPEIHEDLDIGEEQVTSNECWSLEELESLEESVFPDLNLGEEQVTSNECFNVEEE